MRIWNVPCSDLDKPHLLGEHAELHSIWNTITGNKKGWAHHPETKRWRGRLGALYLRHEEQVAEMEKRGYRGHRSPLERNLVSESDSWDWPPVSQEEIERDRQALASRFPGWRKASEELP